MRPFPLQRRHRHRLYPRIVTGPEARRWLREHRDMLSPTQRLLQDAFRDVVAMRETAERPRRAASTRRRLTAAFWAGWNPYFSKTDGRWKQAFRSQPFFGGPLWIGGKR